MQTQKEFHQKKLRVLTAGLTLLMAAVSTHQPMVQADPIGEQQELALSQEERIAIVKEASQAMNQYVHIELKDRKGNEIPQRLWGDAIRNLKPLRVENDRLNVLIMLQEDAQAEHGLYVKVPLSSYLPGHDKRFSVFEKLSQPEDKSFGELFRYQKQKPQNDKQAQYASFTLVTLPGTMLIFTSRLKLPDAPVTESEVPAGLTPLVTLPSTMLFFTSCLKLREATAAQAP